MPPAEAILRAIHRAKIQTPLQPLESCLDRLSPPWDMRRTASVFFHLTPGHSRAFPGVYLAYTCNQLETSRDRSTLAAAHNPGTSRLARSAHTSGQETMGDPISAVAQRAEQLTPPSRSASWSETFEARLQAPRRDTALNGGVSFPMS
jgi:hypothetical protein